MSALEIVLLSVFGGLGGWALCYFFTMKNAEYRWGGVPSGESAFGWAVWSLLWPVILVPTAVLFFMRYKLDLPKLKFPSFDRKSRVERKLEKQIERKEGQAARIARHRARLDELDRQINAG